MNRVWRQDLVWAAVILGLAVVIGLVQQWPLVHQSWQGQLPAVLAQAKYSRDFESEADDFAFHLLHEHAMSPEAFATVMERLETKCGCKPGVLDFLSTHPVTGERIKRARAAAKDPASPGHGLSVD